MADIENTLAQQDFALSHQEKVEEGWEAVFAICT